MGEPNNPPAPRGRKRKESSKSNTKSNKRRASTAKVIVKQESISASPVPLPRNLELSTTEVSQNASSNNNNLSQINCKPKGLTNIPNEIFVQICANLPPSDLLSLTLVCKKLKELLCSPISQETQAIWKTSRTSFMKFLQTPPPPGMDEKSYIVLKQLEKGCQFCHENNFIKVYWEFRVRCCESCLDQKTMSRDKLFIDYCIPKEIFQTLPNIFRIASPFYWIKDVLQAYEIFNSLNEEAKQDWVEHEEEFATMIMQETVKHKQEEQKEQIAKFEECCLSTQQLPNHHPNHYTQFSMPQQQIIIRQPQLTTAAMNFTQITPITPITPMHHMNPMNQMSPMPSMPLTPMIPSMELVRSPQSQFHQSQLMTPRMQNVIPYDRSPYTIRTPPTPPDQQFYSQLPYVSRINHQMVSHQPVIPPCMMPESPQILTPPQVLTPQMVSQNCFRVPQFHH